MLSSHLRLGLSSGLFLLDFPVKILYEFLNFPMCTTRTGLSSLKVGQILCLTLLKMIQLLLYKS